MRLYLQLTRNTEIIPFNYQPNLTGAIHKWIGKNNSVHDSISLYSFSWLQNAEATRTGIRLKPGSYFFISMHEVALAKQILYGIMQDPSVCYGSSVSDVLIKEPPAFLNQHTFFTASPVFIKRRVENNEKHITHEHPLSGQYLTETLQKKLQAAGLSNECVSVKFDNTYMNPQTRIIRYNKIGNRVSVCPVVIEGSSEQLAFAWNIGVGNSTGIGFGALK